MSTQARELPGSPPDAAQPGTPTVAATAPGNELAMSLARPPRWLATSPPTPLRI
jgi:hypothetical protein